MAKTFATVLGIAFLLVGLLGFVAPHLLGAHLSPVHNLVHIVSGVVALYFGLAGTLSGARLFDLIFGAVYLLLGVIGFLLGSPAVPTLGTPGMAADTRLFRLIPGALELGTADHIIHILLGLVFLIGGLVTKASITAAPERT